MNSFLFSFRLLESMIPMKMINFPQVSFSTNQWVDRRFFFFNILELEHIQRKGMWYGMDVSTFNFIIDAHQVFISGYFVPLLYIFTLFPQFRAHIPYQRKIQCTMYCQLLTALHSPHHYHPVSWMILIIWIHFCQAFSWDIRLRLLWPPW